MIEMETQPPKYFECTWIEYITYDVLAILLLLSGNNIGPLPFKSDINFLAAKKNNNAVFNT